MAKEFKQKKKDVALVFGITKDYTFALANTLIGLTKHNKKFWDDIIVYHDGVPEYEQESINKIVKVKFVDLSESEYFQKISESSIETIKKYTIATFYRYECLNLLSEYRQTIWNDVDILIQDDISDLLKFGETNGVAFSAALPGFVTGSAFSKFNNDYEMFRPLWNVGIMVLSDKLTNYKEIYEWCMKASIKYGDMLLWPDLGVLNIALQEFGIEPENIDTDKYVCLPTFKLANKAAIIHAYGDKKFWNDLEYMQKYPEWTQNAIEWSKNLYKNIQNRVPLVSCIMSCYERYDYLIDSIRSLLAQTYVNYEIIVVLEKSKTQDKIAKILEDFNDERIKIIKNTKKLGFAASLNVGIDVAKGKYIARMDDDDLCSPRRFAAQVNFMEKRPELGIVGSDVTAFGRINDRFSAFSENRYIKAATLFYTAFMHPTVMMRKSMMDKHGLRYDPDYFTEDYELWSRAVYLFETANIPDCLVHYRLHADQATNNDAIMYCSHKRVMENQLKKYLGLDLTENEIGTIQIPHRDLLGNFADTDGVFSLRERTIKKVLDANKKLGVYDEEALEYVINWGTPDGMTTNISKDNVEINKDNVEKAGLKKKMKNALKSTVGPVYNRLLNKMEAMVSSRNEELRANLQNQIDDIKKRVRENETKEDRVK